MCKNKRKRLLCVALTLCLLAFLWLPALAADGEGSFTYQYPVGGVSFRIYRVGSVVEDAFVLTGDYAGYAVDLSDEKAGETLEGYIQRDGLQPLAEATTEDGSVTFESLPMAIYLLLGDSSVQDGMKYAPNPVIFSLPQTDEKGDFVWDVEATGKYTASVLPKVCDLSVEKIWEEDDASSRPKSVSVQLLCDGAVYDTVTLGRDNNWSYAWQELEADHDWNLVEQTVPDGYTVSLEQSEGTYVLVNKGTPSTPPPPPTEIPKTGQLWWPVGFLVLGGLAFLSIGLITRRKDRG